VRTVPLSELFEVKYGLNLELNRMTPDPQGVAFVGRSERRNGITGRVAPLPDLQPLPAGTLTVAGGGSVLATFLQVEPYYSGRDLYYLIPKQDLTLSQKLFYCACIRANRYRYSYGRQANRTLRDIRVPALAELPDWVDAAAPTAFDGKDAATLAQISLPPPEMWQPVVYEQLFEIERGRGPRRKDLNGMGDTPFITAIDSKNGLTGFTTLAATHPGNTISVNRNGNGVADAFYQPVPFCSTEDVHIFKPRFNMTPSVGLFLAVLIRREKYRFSYGRKWSIERMKKAVIRLPVDAVGEPDWMLMERYINGLPYSSQVGGSAAS
jgi:Type I restriction modification DNA specificity domain